ncbi:hypothetical protein [Phaeacidiphilus oryzae]|uniref:hypothetical protein n=1 Tax=Phaeacidiphilus oryzae TaxID=348818 RepID=UPI000691D8E6|nr:hypothetical protein [Phaeacidiphilus oryzae]
MRTRGGGGGGGGGAGTRLAAALALLLTLVLLVLLVLGITVAAAPGARAAGPSAAAGPQSQRLAALLRRNPIYLSDQLPRTVPRSLAPSFAAAAKRTGVPTYVLVLPDGQPTGLLSAVHDRLGRPGLYVLVGPQSLDDAQTFGVSAPADDAQTVVTYAVTYDAGPLRKFQVFADTVALGPAKAAALAQREQRHPSARVGQYTYPDRADRGNQQFTTGLLVVGTPVAVLLFSGLVRRSRRPGPARSGPARSGRRGFAITCAVATVLAGAVAFGAGQVFDQTRDSAAPTPTRADLDARLDRVAAGLSRSPVYADPESPDTLTAAQTAELERRSRAFKPGPILFALIPSLLDDESEGDEEATLSALHHRLGRPAVYVLADPLTGEITADAYGLRISGLQILFDLPDSITAPPAEAASAGDSRLGPRLDQLTVFLSRLPLTDGVERGLDTPPPPLDDHVLPSLWSGQFPGGAVVGVLAALALRLLAAGGLRLARRPAGRPAPGEGGAAGDGAAAGAVPAHKAPAAPSVRWLRTTAQHELDALGEDLAAADAPGPAGSPAASPSPSPPPSPSPSASASATSPSPSHRNRAWDCLDAALLLVDRDPDGQVDPDAAPADLLAAIVLARAGTSALRGDAYDRCCTVNPLHGPTAQGVRRARSCAACRANAGSEATGRGRLTLPPPPGAPLSQRVPYLEPPGILRAVRDGIPQLISKARESASVQ